MKMIDESKVRLKDYSSIFPDTDQFLWQVVETRVNGHNTLNLKNKHFDHLLRPKDIEGDDNTPTFYITQTTEPCEVTDSMKLTYWDNNTGGGTFDWLKVSNDSFEWAKSEENGDKFQMILDTTSDSTRRLLVELETTGRHLEAEQGQQQDRRELESKQDNNREHQEQRRNLGSRVNCSNDLYNNGYHKICLKTDTTKCIKMMDKEKTRLKTYDGSDNFKWKTPNGWDYTLGSARTEFLNKAFNDHTMKAFDIPGSDDNETLFKIAQYSDSCVFDEPVIFSYTVTSGYVKDHFYLKVDSDDDLKWVTTADNADKFYIMDI